VVRRFGMYLGNSPNGFGEDLFPPRQNYTPPPFSAREKGRSRPAPVLLVILWVMSVGLFVEKSRRARQRIHPPRHIPPWAASEGIA
jgi:hypothetical protein